MKWWLEREVWWQAGEKYERTHILRHRGLLTGRNLVAEKNCKTVQPEKGEMDGR